MIRDQMSEIGCQKSVDLNMICKFYLKILKIKFDYLAKILDLIFSGPQTSRPLIVNLQPLSTNH